MLHSVINKIKIWKFKKKYKKYPHFEWNGTGFLNCETEVDPSAHVKISNKAFFRNGCIIRVRENADLCIGENVSFNNGCMITCRKSIKIGNNVLIGPNVLLFDHDHDYRSEDMFHKFKIGNIVIEDNVWIGGNCTILRNTTLHEGVVVGAGCVVKGDIPAYTVITQKAQFPYDKQETNVVKLTKDN